LKLAPEAVLLALAVQRNRVAVQFVALTAARLFTPTRMRCVGLAGIQPEGESEARLDLPSPETRFDALRVQHDFSVPVAPISDQDAELRPLAGRHSRPIREVGVTGRIAFPAGDLQTDRAQDLLLEVGERVGSLGLELAAQQFAEDREVTRASLKALARFCDHFECERAFVMIGGIFPQQRPDPGFQAARVLEQLGARP